MNENDETMNQYRMLFQLWTGFWPSCLLHTAVKLDVFTELSEKPSSVEEVAVRLDIDRRAAELLLDALVGREFLTKKKGVYSNTPLSQKFLVNTSSFYLGYIIRHGANMYPDWGRLEEAIRSGRPLRLSHTRPPEELENFILGMHNLAYIMAPKIAKSISLDDAKDLLDLGGGPGTYAIHFCKIYTNLKATIFDLPNVLPITEKVIKSFGMSDRINLVAGDFHKDSLPGPFDTAWLSHIIHGDGPESCKALIEKVYRILNPEGKIIVQDFILDETKTKPPFASLFALNMLIHTNEGRTYSFSEIEEWLRDTGFTNIKNLDLVLANDASIVMASKS